MMTLLDFPLVIGFTADVLVPRAIVPDPPGKDNEPCPGLPSGDGRTAAFKPQPTRGAISHGAWSGVGDEIDVGVGSRGG
jgi:hypothetical protein